MKKYRIEVISTVEVTLDETKFTSAFMHKFRDSLYPFDSIADHAGHIAQLEARGLLRPNFIEGYGPAKDMGISANVLEVEVDEDPTVISL